MSIFNTNAAGHLEIDGSDAVDLAAEFGTPLWAISAGRIRDNYRRLRDAFTRVYPESRIVYASKANPEPAVIRVLKLEGALVDAVTMGHIRLALAAGFEPGEIVFNGNSKTLDELRWAVANGMGYINVDSLEEMEALAALQAPDARPVAVCLRVAVDNRRHIADDTEFRRWEWLGKFGMDDDDILMAAEIAAAHPGLDLAGLHNHVGFTAYGLAYDAELDLLRHRRCVEQTLEVARMLAERGMAPRVLNFGGGFRVGNPAGYGPGRLTSFPTADDYAETTAGLVATAGVGQPTVLLEAGGYLVSDAAVLLATVGFGKRRRADAESREWAFLENTGGYHLVRRLMFGFHHEVGVANRMADRADTTVSIAGPACADDDVCLDARLPRLRRGDLLAVFDNGAYCESVTSDYCAVPIPAAVLVDDGRAAFSRRRETVADIEARFCVPSWLAAPAVPA